MTERDDTTFDDELMANAARLATTVRPERDLWPEIEQSISTPAGRSRSVWNTVWAQAAAVLLLVGGSSGVTYLAMSGDDDPTVPVADGTPQLVFEPASASFGSQYNLGPDYVDARRVLSGNLSEQLEALSPEAREEVLTNIETIRNAIDDINRALANDPDNVLLQQLLIDTYRDELAVMRKVDVISNAAMYRGDI
jgi:phosphoserine phosphatase